MNEIDLDNLKMEIPDSNRKYLSNDNLKIDVRLIEILSFILT